MPAAEGRPVQDNEPDMVPRDGHDGDDDDKVGDGGEDGPVAMPPRVPSPQASPPLDQPEHVLEHDEDDGYTTPSPLFGTPTEEQQVELLETLNRHRAMGIAPSYVVSPSESSEEEEHDDGDDDKVGDGGADDGPASMIIMSCVPSPSPPKAPPASPQTPQANPRSPLPELVLVIDDDDTPPPPPVLDLRDMHQAPSSSSSSSSSPFTCNTCSTTSYVSSCNTPRCVSKRAAQQQLNQNEVVDQHNILYSCVPKIIIITFYTVDLAFRLYPTLASSTSFLVRTLIKC